MPLGSPLGSPLGGVFGGTGTGGGTGTSAGSIDILDRLSAFPPFGGTVPGGGGGSAGYSPGYAGGRPWVIYVAPGLLQIY